jgi:UDP-glucose 4-epimerase
MRIFLVTGGAGFIGSHLCEALRRRQHGVRVLDDLSSGSRANLPPGVEFMHGDIGCPDTVSRALEGVAGCFHLAAIASVERGVRDWLGTHRVNLTGTITILDGIRRSTSSSAPIPFVYASSAAVYGDAAGSPLTESTEKRPLSAYGADKYACELHAAVGSHVHRIPTVGLRFFNVFGPRQDPMSPYSGVISIFCDRLLRDAPVEIYGDGLQTRDFVYVDDVVGALLNAMDRRDDPVVLPAVFNVCSGNPVSVLDLVRTIAELAGKKPEIRFMPPRAGEVRHSAGCPEAARARFAVAQPTPLRTGLAKVLAWMRDNAAG